MAIPTAFTEIAAQMGIPLALLIIVLIWTLVWKALALWKAARNNSPIWFIALFVINTLGILEILYIFLFSKIKLPKVKGEKKAKKKR